MFTFFLLDLIPLDRRSDPHPGAARFLAPARVTPGSPRRPFAADTSRHLWVSSGKPAVRLNRKSRRAEYRAIRDCADRPGAVIQSLAGPEEPT